MCRISLTWYVVAFLALFSGCAGVLGVDDVSYQEVRSSDSALDAGSPSDPFPRMVVLSGDAGLLMLPDAFQEAVDSSFDALSDTKSDASLDTKSDASLDAKSDASLDASLDAVVGPDASVSTDASLDAALDAPPDALPDTGPASTCNCGGSYCPLWTLDDAGGPTHVNCEAVANRTIHTCASVPVVNAGCEYVGSDVVYGYRWYCCLP